MDGLKSKKTKVEIIRSINEQIKYLKDRDRKSKISTRLEFIKTVNKKKHISSNILRSRFEDIYINERIIRTLERLLE